MLPLVLGSSSAYRKELLERLGLPFSVCSPRVDETALPGEMPPEMALRLAVAKAEAAARQFPRALIIGSDQVAHYDGEIFGKPGTHENAVRQLNQMSGHTVSFQTALCLLNSESGTRQVRLVPTEISFRELEDGQIERYLRREAPYQCAGSAKIERLGIALIREMRSDDPTAIIGLPLIALCDMLVQEGVKVL